MGGESSSNREKKTNQNGDRIRMGKYDNQRDTAGFIQGGWIPWDLL